MDGDSATATTTATVVEQSCLRTAVTTISAESTTTFKVLADDPYGAACTAATVARVCSIGCHSTIVSEGYANNNLYCSTTLTTTPCCIVIETTTRPRLIRLLLVIVCRATCTT